MTTTPAPGPPDVPDADNPVVLYRTDGPVAVITLNRPEYPATPRTRR